MVRTWHARDRMSTALTAIGVNDAPSLKKADCGIAVEGASEAAQAAADIVFLAPGLSTIVLAIKTARQIFQRMKAYIQYRIALCLHLEIYLVCAGALYSLPSPGRMNTNARQVTSMIIINETIRAELIVFIALFADLATVAVAYDVSTPPLPFHHPLVTNDPRTHTLSKDPWNGSSPRSGLLASSWAYFSHWQPG